MRGFTLIEIVVVIAIVAIVGSVTVTGYGALRGTTDSRFAEGVYADALKVASLNARTMLADTAWGVRVNAGNIIVFSGATYDSRVASRDMTFGMASGLSVSGVTEVRFAKLTGLPHVSGTTTFSNKYASSSVYVFPSGAINI